MTRSISGVGDTWWRANQVFVDTPAATEAFVDETARLGYVQIKARDIKGGTIYDPATLGLALGMSAGKQ